jgi:enamine deaminase RidA (YjgF/YER057c/UK114 family)
MSHLQYFAYPDYGLVLREKLHYSQAVRVGNLIETAGQGTLSSPAYSIKQGCVNRNPSLTCEPTNRVGGWDPATGEVHKDINDEMDQAFANVDLALRDAGGKGWSQVYRVKLYFTMELNDESVGALVRNLKKWMPEHQPILTGVGVPTLGQEGMRVEVEVSALDEEGAEAAKAARKAGLEKE